MGCSKGVKAKFQENETYLKTKKNSQNFSYNCLCNLNFKTTYLYIDDCC